jgi:hypothetical protein
LKEIKQKIMIFLYIISNEKKTIPEKESNSYKLNLKNLKELTKVNKKKLANYLIY